MVLSKLVREAWNRDDGVLSFEWVVLVTIIIIGIVSGVAAARDAIIDEMGDVSQGMICLDQSYSIDFPLLITITQGPFTYDGSASDSSFTDGAAYIDCPRNQSPVGQLGAINNDSESTP